MSPSTSGDIALLRQEVESLNDRIAAIENKHDHGANPAMSAGATSSPASTPGGSAANAGSAVGGTAGDTSSGSVSGGSGSATATENEMMQLRQDIAALKERVMKMEQERISDMK